MSAKGARDFGFFIWTIPGFLMAFGVAAILTIGLPLLLLGAGLFLYLLFRGPVWPADLGLISGVGAAALLLSWFALIGDRTPTVWIGIGLTLIAVSAGPYCWLRRRPSRYG